MPTYSFQCTACGNIFDLTASIQEKEEGKGEKFACPKCKSKNIKQEFSAANFIKNVFKKDAPACGCCPGGSVCGPQSAEDKKNNCCGPDNNSCCG